MYSADTIEIVIEIMIMIIIVVDMETTKKWEMERREQYENNSTLRSRGQQKGKEPSCRMTGMNDSGRKRIVKKTHGRLKCEDWVELRS